MLCGGLAPASCSPLWQHARCICVAPCSLSQPLDLATWYRVRKPALGCPTFLSPAALLLPPQLSLYSLLTIGHPLLRDSVNLLATNTPCAPPPPPFLSHTHAHSHTHTCAHALTQAHLCNRVALCNAAVHHVGHVGQRTALLQGEADHPGGVGRDGCEHGGGVCV